MDEATDGRTHWDGCWREHADCRAVRRERWKRAGQKGGKARAAKLSPERRSEIARLGGLAGGRGRKRKATISPP